ncbi:GNAT family N-acetyltransferase [Halobacillus karajensis]|uniref:Ribosomal-protein-alanine acetyltransferase n=1 Tax=Halobacillus karajensis TaxID=195088 RepID=A0A024P7Y4_9BACI|nr:GNAT family N-acetyltransferase [Halobacillus karajensis]CDQ20284.1 ribosomal-protein-alanine acetyltransferase [Halobacillus karajensis]CDQ25055.1 ribosomal-protein-alanine acetyltransferase [Halobacillus karajensis]CDQ28584.1 ribosomal-protein-alanine acetyltransferase [Halobacillus karajensis]
MIRILPAGPNHVDGIVRVCTEGNRATYAGIYPEHYIEEIIEQFYTPARILDEVIPSGREWGGYMVAIEGDEVIGACGGGMVDKTETELYVLYLDPSRRKEGIGTMLLDTFTKQQIDLYGATKQWVSVQEGNDKGVPFYEARGFIFSHKEPGYGSEEAKKYTSLRYWRDLVQK